MIISDLMLILKKIGTVRKEQGKDNNIVLMSRKSIRNAQLALQTSKIVGKSDYSREIKKFLNQIKDLQERIKKKEEQNKNYLGVVSEDDDDEVEEEIVVPVQIKPFLNKEINFNLFIEMLTEKVDQQRVAISLKQFNEIEFS